MARLIRSPRAKQDIIEVIAFTKERWGEAQARAYVQLIKEDQNVPKMHGCLLLLRSRQWR